MKLTLQRTGLDRVAGQAVLVPVYEREGGKILWAAAVPARLAQRLTTQLRERPAFQGRLNQTVVLPTEGGARAPLAILVGLGKRVELTLERVRQAAATAVKAARAQQAARCALALVEPAGGLRIPAIAQATAEGVWLGLYRFLQHRALKPEEKTELASLAIVTAAHERDARAGLEKGRILAEAANFARDLVNQPANIATPTYLAQQAQRMSRQFGIRCRVLDEAACRRLGMGAFLSVAAGSVQPPKFIILEYTPRTNPKATFVFCGKGITFDSGGISIKPSEGMEKMKYDMAGGAAVIGTLRAAATLHLPYRVVGLVVATENLPSGKATKPGDVVRAMNGMTIEVLNTDAEGRLVLSDALAYAHRYQPTAVVDLATLTGACVVALGTEAIGLMGTDERLTAALKRAGDATHERVWELPLWEEYDDAVKSDVADLRNIGNRGEAGTIAGAAFLKPFAKGYPWAHLDIAGTAWAERERPYYVKGSTAVGVRLLIAMMEGWQR